MKHFIILILALCLNDNVFPNIINIPNNFSSIQEGINAANFGDTILVEPGEYYENIILNKDGLLIASNFIFSNDKEDISETIIDGQTQVVITVKHNITESTSIIGFSIQNGEDGLYLNGEINFQNNYITDCIDGIDYKNGGGGICKNNVFEGNGDDGIDLDSAVNIIIEDNLIFDNLDDGIEIRLHPYVGDTLRYVIRNNIIYGNGEDGIQFVDYPEITPRTFLIERNLIFDNEMAGIGCMSDGNTIEDYEGAPIPEVIFLFNNVIDDNEYGITGGHNLVSVNNIISNSLRTGVKNVSGNSNVSYCLLYGNYSDHDNSNIDFNTTIFKNPLLNKEYHLLEASPCIDQGTAKFSWQSKTVLNIPENKFFGEAPDIGVYESNYIASTSILKNKNNDDILPWVNHEVIYFSMSNKFIYNHLLIFDTNGKTVIHKKNLSENYIDVSEIKKGIYIVRLDGIKNSLTKKVLLY